MGCRLPPSHLRILIYNLFCSFVISQESLQSILGKKIQSIIWSWHHPWILPLTSFFIFFFFFVILPPKFVWVSFDTTRYFFLLEKNQKQIIILVAGFLSYVVYWDEYIWMTPFNLQNTLRDDYCCNSVVYGRKSGHMSMVCPRVREQRCWNLCQRLFEARTDAPNTKLSPSSCP